MKLSIITVCYNAEKYIGACIDSVLALDANDFEYIIIDGLSTDSTINIARSYESAFLHKKIPYQIISEKDIGTYDAMNKGIFIAKGDWILYMNSDDRFFDKKCINNFMSSNLERYGVVYGDVIAVKDEKTIYRIPEKLERLKSGVEMPFCHQSAFTKRELLKQYLFDLKYWIVADIELYLRMYENNIEFMYMPGCIAYFSCNGVSQTERVTSIQQGKEMLRNHGCYTIDRRIALNVYELWYHVKKYLPDGIANVILKVKNVLTAKV